MTQVAVVDTTPGTVSRTPDRQIRMADSR